MDIRTSKDLLKNSNEKIIKQRRKRRLSFSALFFILFVLLLIGAIFFLRNQKFLLTTVNVSGNVFVESKDIENGIKDYESGKYFWIIPKRNLVLIHTNKLEQYLMKNFPNIKTVSVTRNFPHTVSVYMTERKGVYLWCGNDVSNIEKNSDRPCDFTDSDGFIFNVAPYFSGTQFFAFFGGDSGIGKVIIDKTEFQKIIYIKKGIEDLGLHPFAISILPEGEYRLYINDDGTSNNNSPQIKFNNKINEERIIENLSSAISSKVFIDGSAIKKLSYIDLRFGNKVFYKFK